MTQQLKPATWLQMEAVSHADFSNFPVVSRERGWNAGQTNLVLG